MKRGEVIAFPRSLRPPWGSISAPSASRAIALMVRSRRPRSSSRVTSEEVSKLEAVIAGTHFALGARQCVLFPGFGVQENGKVFTDGFVASSQELFGAAANDDPVVLVHTALEQSVPDCATNLEDLHGRMIP